MIKARFVFGTGGICVLKDENDYDSYFEDTMRAGHYENNKESVDINDSFIKGCYKMTL